MAFRLAVLLLLVGGLGVSGYFRSKAARTGEQIERTAEGGLALFARMFAAVPLMVAVLLFVFWPPGIAWAEIALPSWVRGIGVTLGVAAVLGSAWTLHSLGTNVSATVLTKVGQTLVTTGPYGWVRHPLYSFGLLLLCSIGIVASNGFILGWTFLFFVPLRFVVIRREECELMERFGDEYAAYRNRTGAMLPRFFR